MVWHAACGESTRIDVPAIFTSRRARSQGKEGDTRGINFKKKRSSGSLAVPRFFFVQENEEREKRERHRAHRVRAIGWLNLAGYSLCRIFLAFDQPMQKVCNHLKKGFESIKI